MTGTLISAKIEDDLVEFITSDGTWSYTPVGDCCACAHVHDPSIAMEEVESCIGKRIISADHEEIHDTEEQNNASECLDIHFYSILMEDGTSLKITLYVEHNGYYRGWLNGGKQS